VYQYIQKDMTGLDNGFRREHLFGVRIRPVKNRFIQADDVLLELMPKNGASVLAVCVNGTFVID